MSYFERIAMENDDTVGFGNPANLANGETDESTSAVIAEVQGLAYEADEEVAASEELEGEQEAVEETLEAVEGGEEGQAQEAALDPTAARILAVSMKHILGARHARRIVPATESFNGTRSQARENTRIAIEGIKETLKQFWEAIKAQFKKTFNALKTVVKKTFSASKKLLERAEKIQDRANNLTGTAEEKTFSFGQTKAIAVAGKYNTPSDVLKGLSTLAEVVDKSLQEFKKSKLDDDVEAMVKKIKATFGDDRKSIKGLDDLTKTVKEAVKGASFTNPDSSVGNVEKFKQQFGWEKGEGNRYNVEGIFGLPGSKAIVRVTYTPEAGTDIEAGIKALKGNKLYYTNDKDTAREVTEGDVKTLTTSQIDGLCDSVIKIAEAVNQYEKTWETRDRFVEKVQRDIDDVIKEVNQDDEKFKDKEQRNFRNFATAAVGCVRSSTNFQAALCTQSLTTSNAFLNYAERSLAQYK